MSCAELLEPMTTHFLPAKRSAADVPARVILHAGEASRRRAIELVRRAVCAGREHELLWTQHRCSRPRVDQHRPLALPSIVARVEAFGRSPVVELHHPGIHLQPIAHLVLRREHRPVVRERQVGQVVVPDRVVQHERLVAVPPRVAGARVLLQDDGRHAEALQPRAERDAALSAADDDAIGLPARPERRRFARLRSSQFLRRWTRRARRRARARRRPLLVALELRRWW